MKNILVIQLSRLGDIIQSIPLLGDLRQSYPEANMHMLINDVFAESSILLPGITTHPIILEDLFLQNNLSIGSKYANELLANLLSLNFDYIINLNNSPVARYFMDGLTNLNPQLLTPHSSLLTQQAGFGTPQSAFWSFYITSFLRSRHLNSINLVDIFRRFHQPSGDFSQGFAYQFTHSPQRVIGLQCGARNQKRQFTLTQYADIAKHYIEKGYQIYLFGLPSESGTARQICQMLQNEKVIDLVGKTSLADLVKYITQCETIFTPDTGTMHLAALCGTPITTLFCGPAYPHETLAYTPNIKVYMPDITCYPCKEDEACSFGMQCHNFSFERMLNGVENPGFIALNVEYDEIGQVLMPLGEQTVLWRSFAKYYFLGSGEASLSPELLKKIDRELQLLQVIDKEDIATIESNIDFLLPCIYHEKLFGNTTLLTSLRKYLIYSPT